MVGDKTELELLLTKFNWRDLIVVEMNREVTMLKAHWREAGDDRELERLNR